MRSSQTNLPAGLTHLHAQAREPLSVTELMLDTSTSFAWAVDAHDFGLLWFNRRIREHFLEHRLIQMAVGMRPCDLFGDSAACEEWLGLFHRALRDGPFSVDYAMHFGGRKLLLTVSPMVQDGKLTGISVFGQDNSEGVRLRETLAESEEKFRVGFEQGAVGQALASTQGQFLQVNGAFARMLGYEERDLIGRPQADVIHPDDRAHALQAMERLIVGAATCRCDIRYVTHGGATIWVDGSVALVRDAAGKPLYFVCTFVDMTGHKIAEDERARFEAQWKKTMEGTTQTLSMALEIRDPHTAGHQRRVAELACAIWDRLGLPEERREGLRIAALLHDLGKLAIPADILSKPSKLNAIERALVQQHSVAGWDVLRLVEFPWPIATMVRQHHERQDGSGYPDGLRGDEILMESSVLAVADVVEAMASHRPYRAAICIAKVLEEVSHGRGKLYRPEVVDACLQVFGEGYLLPI